MLLFSLLLSPPAAACAGFFHQPNSFVESAAQQAILQRGDGYVQIDYQADVVVDTPEFGWVIPIAGTFQSLSDGDASRFEDLFVATGPRYELEEVEEGGCGAQTDKGGGLSDSAANGSFDMGVTVVYEGATPTYDYTVLSADSADALTGWLEEHGWTVGESGPSIAEYVADGGFQFVAIKLGLSLTEGQSVSGTLPPISVRYEGDRMVYPARMGRYAMDEYIRTILYVLGDQRARISGGWDEEELSVIWEEGEDPTFMRNEAYPQGITSLGVDGRFAVTYAGAYDGAWATRFETHAPREMYTEDVDFEVDAGQTETQLVVSNMGGCDAPEGAKALLFLPLLGMMRRRK